MRPLYINIEKCLPYFGTLWLFVVLDSIIVWNPFETVTRLLAFVGVIGGSLYTKSIVNSKYAYRIFFLLLFFFLWLTLRMSDNLIGVASHTLDYMPFFFILFWPTYQIDRTYRLVRKLVIFFAIGGAIVSILTLLGLISYVPHYVLPPREQLHIKLGYEYFVYGVFATIHDPMMLLPARACGMMREPGHLAVILGFVYLIDRFRKCRINLWIIICGALTFSSAFFLIVAFTELHYFFTIKYYWRIIKYGSLIALVIFIIFIFMPSEIRDQTYYLFYERNLEKVMETMDSSSSLNEALDVRANGRSVWIYEHISFKDFLIGGVKFDTADSLADYRGLILQMGLIGVVLSTILYLITIVGTKNSLKIALLLSFILIMTHRSWMLRAPYVYFLSIVAVSLTSPSNNNRLITPKKK